MKKSEAKSWLNIDKYLGRLIVGGLVIAFVASQFLWAGRLFARIWNFPELRHQLVLRSSENEGTSIASVTVSNLGFGAAENVLVHINSRGRAILSYNVDAQELYEVKSIDLENGVIDIWLDRIAPGARIEIVVEAQQLSENSLRLSAASDHGTSMSIDNKTFSDQIKGYVGTTTRLFEEAYEIVANSEAIQQVDTWITKHSDVASFLKVVSSDEFRTVGLALLLLTIVIGLFFSYKHFMFCVAAGAWFLTWIFFFDVRIPAAAVIIPVGGVVGAFLLSLVYAEEDDATTAYFGILVVLVIMALVWRTWGQSVSASAFVGLVVAFIMSLIIDWAGIFKESKDKTNESDSN